MAEVVREAGQKSGSEGVAVYGDPAAVGGSLVGNMNDISVAGGIFKLYLRIPARTVHHRRRFLGQSVRKVKLVGQIPGLPRDVFNGDLCDGGGRSASCFNQKLGNGKPGGIVPVSIGFEVPLVIPVFL